jgi:hypothetical protein
MEQIVREARAAAHAAGASAERARIIRCRNACFKGATWGDAAVMVMRFDGMVIRGEDPEFLADAVALSEHVDNLNRPV